MWQWTPDPFVVCSCTTRPLGLSQKLHSHLVRLNLKGPASPGSLSRIWEIPIIPIFPIPIFSISEIIGKSGFSNFRNYWKIRKIGMLIGNIGIIGMSQTQGQESISFWLGCMLTRSIWKRCQNGDLFKVLSWSEQDESRTWYTYIAVYPKTNDFLCLWSQTLDMYGASPSLRSEIVGPLEFELAAPMLEQLKPPQCISMKPPRKPYVSHDTSGKCIVVVPICSGMGATKLIYWVLRS